MEFKKWKNKYIELVSSRPDKLLACVDEEFSAAEEQLLTEKLKLSPETYCDIGSGSGGHLLEQAKLNPAALFIGVELRYKRAFRSIEKAEGFGLNNVLVLRTDARSAISKFPDSALNGVFVNFPDPWDKRRWFKNRLLNPNFLEQLLNKLKPGGFISYKSDHHEYFAVSLELFQKFQQLQIEKISYNWHQEVPAGLNIMSEFEKLFHSKGLAVNYLLARKL